MNKTSKSISGLKNGKKVFPKPSKYFTDSEKHQIIKELLDSGCTKVEIWRKYTGQYAEHGQLLRWMRKLGYDTSYPNRIPNFAENISLMAKHKKAESNIIEDFEVLQMKRRIAELEDQLKDAQMKAIAFSTMVDIAEKEFNIPIRKKYNTKPSKK